MSAPAAWTFNIQRFSTEDGPGIRTTVFFKGCALRCAWCHNPEGLRAGPDLMWFDVRCIGARDCLRACPNGALALTPSGMRIDRQRCDVCGACVEACPTAAFERLGRTWTAAVLLEEVLKDQVFYETSGGGVTLSGGEPMLQADFLEAFLPDCREAGLHIALDTCGLAPWERYAALLPSLDLVLLDLKIFDGARHLAATGAGNVRILENARRLSEAGAPLWIRTPLVPGYTADRANIEALARFIAAELPTVERWDLLVYTNLGKPKYLRLDLPYALGDEPLPERALVESLWQAALAIVPCARWSGATRVPADAAVAAP